MNNLENQESQNEYIRSANIDTAKELYDKNNFEKAVKISMELLKVDYDNNEAHELLVKIFNELGSENNLVVDSRLNIKDMLLKQSRHF